jgi:hypothetical protein
MIPAGSATGRGSSIEQPRFLDDRPSPFDERGRPLGRATRLLVEWVPSFGEPPRPLAEWRPQCVEGAGALVGGPEALVEGAGALDEGPGALDEGPGALDEGPPPLCRLSAVALAMAALASVTRGASSPRGRAASRGRGPPCTGRSGFHLDVVDGRFVIETRFRGRRWEVVVEPDDTDHILVVVTAYGLEP